MAEQKDFERFAEELSELLIRHPEIADRFKVFVEPQSSKVTTSWLKAQHAEDAKKKCPPGKKPKWDANLLKWVCR